MKKKMLRNLKKAGFTLIEVVISLALITIVTATAISIASSANYVDEGVDTLYKIKTLAQNGLSAFIFSENASNFEQLLAVDNKDFTVENMNGTSIESLSDLVNADEYSHYYLGDIVVDYGEPDKSDDGSVTYYLKDSTVGSQSQILYTLTGQTRAQLDSIVEKLSAAKYYETNADGSKTEKSAYIKKEATYRYTFDFVAQTEYTNSETIWVIQQSQSRNGQKTQKQTQEQERNRSWSLLSGWKPWSSWNITSTSGWSTQTDWQFSDWSGWVEDSKTNTGTVDNAMLTTVTIENTCEVFLQYNDNGTLKNYAIDAAKTTNEEPVWELPDVELYTREKKEVAYNNQNIKVTYDKNQNPTFEGTLDSAEWYEEYEGLELENSGVTTTNGSEVTGDTTPGKWSYTWQLSSYEKQKRTNTRDVTRTDTQTQTITKTEAAEYSPKMENVELKTETADIKKVEAQNIVFSSNGLEVTKTDFNSLDSTGKTGYTIVYYDDTVYDAENNSFVILTASMNEDTWNTTKTAYANEWGATLVGGQVQSQMEYTVPYYQIKADGEKLYYNIGVATNNMQSFATYTGTNAEVNAKMAQYAGLNMTLDVHYGSFHCVDWLGDDHYFETAAIEDGYLIGQTDSGTYYFSLNKGKFFFTNAFIDTQDSNADKIALITKFENSATELTKIEKSLTSNSQGKVVVNGKKVSLYDGDTLVVTDELSDVSQLTKYATESKQLSFTYSLTRYVGSVCFEDGKMLFKDQSGLVLYGVAATDKERTAAVACMTGDYKAYWQKESDTVYKFIGEPTEFYAVIVNDSILQLLDKKNDNTPIFSLTFGTTRLTEYMSGLNGDGEMLFNASVVTAKQYSIVMDDYKLVIQVNFAKNKYYAYIYKNSEPISGYSDETDIDGNAIPVAYIEYEKG